MKRIRVLVVDDSPTMLQLVASVLESDPAIEVVASGARCRNCPPGNQGFQS